MPKPKPAVVVAVTYAVICPDCGEDQAEPDGGSLVWDPSQLTHHAGPRACRACGTIILVQPLKKLVRTN